MTIAPITYLRPKFDSEGKPILRPNGRRVMEQDYLAGVADQPLPHALCWLGVFFIVRAAVIRFRPTASTPSPTVSQSK